MSAAPVDPEIAEALPPLVAPDARAVDAARCVRFYELRFWLRGVGCCWACAQRLAIVQVEREAGLRCDPGGTCAEEENGCKDKARAAWRTMPGRKAP